MVNKVLIHSGGGCKGYMPLQTLEKIENKVGPLYGHYDIMFGSSVGAINSAILATGKLSASQLNKIYPEMIKKTFTKRPFPQRFLKSLYDRKNFIDIWNHYVGEDFKMKDCKCGLVLTSVNLMTKRNHFFKSWEEKDGEEKLLDVVLRSFAAPLYFGTLVDDKNQAVWMDGGMGDSNIPIDFAVMEALDIQRWNRTHFDILGCGYTDDTISFKNAKNYKTIKQILQYFDVPDGGLARTQSREEQISKLMIRTQRDNRISFNYYDIEIPKKIDKLDGVECLDDYRIYGSKMSENPLLLMEWSENKIHPEMGLITIDKRKNMNKC